MKVTRREFLRYSLLAGVTVGSGAAGILLAPREAHAVWPSSPALRKFIQPLRGVSLPPYATPGIPVALPDRQISYGGGLKADHYTISVAQYNDQLHPDLPGPTKLWGYADASNGSVFRHLGGIIVAQRGVPVQLTVINNLPATQILPLDLTVPGANAQQQNRTAVHLHGGFVPWISDGGPFDWFTPAPPAGTTWKVGKSFLNNAVLNPNAPPGQAEYYYPNLESARMMWYHDHAWGITRLNAYAGVATAYMVRDPNGLEGQLIARGLPDYVENGGREIPLVFQDKIFVKNNVATTDPSWPIVVPGTTQGDLWYPHIYDPLKWALRPGANPALLPDPSVIPEFFGDTMLCNGTVYPTVTLEARRYRFRILNACNARFLNLMLFREDPNNPGEVRLNAAGNVTSPPGPAFTQIGTEGGFLFKPVTLNNPPKPFNPVMMTGNLVLAPAERADIIIDFAGLAAGTKLILYNDSPSPFPVGAPDNDFYPGNTLNPVRPNPGFGPNTRTLLQIVITAATSADPPLNLRALTMEPAPLVPPAAGVIGGVTQIPPGVIRRRMTLNEEFDKFGRLTTRLGTDVPVKGARFGKDFTDPVDTFCAPGTTEVWEILNLSADTHPMHFHLFNVQIISRQPFDALGYKGGAPTFTGPARLPQANERGWKETVRCNPGEVITVIGKIELPAVPFVVPSSPRTGGNEYVWHCHILEHEEHDMMRPVVVI